MTLSQSSFSADDPVVTDAQRDFWARRGYLLAKGLLSSEAVAALARHAGFADRAPAQRTDDAALIDLTAFVADLLDEALVPVLMRSGGGARPMRRDVWARKDALAEHGVVVTVALTPSQRADCEILLYAESQEIGAPIGTVKEDDVGPTDRSDVIAEMAEFLPQLTRRGLAAQTLTYEAGDVWLRDPFLFHGAIATRPERATEVGAIEIVFGRPEDLPRDPVAPRIGGASPIRTQKISKPRVEPVTVEL